MTRRQIQISIPEWLDEQMDRAEPRPDSRAWMEFVISLARENVRRGTGGPFGAAVVEWPSGRLVAAGVNLVMPSGNSTAHAEMVAIMLAESSVGDYDLGSADQPLHELVTSVEPCAMCLGAIVWSGVHKVSCGARDADARAIGFDEGPKPPDWRGQLESRGIEVARDVLREEAAGVLEEYATKGGTIYNPRR